MNNRLSLDHDRVIMKHEIAVELWESNEYVVIVDGIGVVGQTLSRRDADVVSQWLRTAISAIVDTGTQTAQNETTVILNSDELALISRALCSYEEPELGIARAGGNWQQAFAQMKDKVQLRNDLVRKISGIMHNQLEKHT